MATSARNAPCFCGSGRKFKHCCARTLTEVRTWRSVEGRCRWRFWRPHSAEHRYASQIAEHVCDGQRFWIARDTDAGTSWQIDHDPVTLLEVLDHIHGAHYHWVIEQTMSALNHAAPATDPSPPADPDSERLVPADIHHLLLEVLRLAHAGDALEAQLPASLKHDQRLDLPLRDRAFIKLAS